MADLYFPHIRVTQTDVKKAIEYICDKLDSPNKRKGGEAGGQALLGVMF